MLYFTKHAFNMEVMSLQNCEISRCNNFYSWKSLEILKFSNECLWVCIPYASFYCVIGELVLPLRVWAMASFVNLCDLVKFVWLKTKRTTFFCSFMQIDVIESLIWELNLPYFISKLSTILLDWEVLMNMFQVFALHGMN
jgi:hypothetical protein